MSWVSSEQNNRQLSTLCMETEASGAVYRNYSKSNVSVVREAMKKFSSGPFYFSLFFKTSICSVFQILCNLSKDANIEQRNKKNQQPCSSS